MLSSTLKRTAATLGVLAGLLAGTAPASAQLPATTVGVTTPPPGQKAPAGAAWVWHEAARNGAVTNRDSAGHTVLIEVGMGMSEDFVKAPHLGVASGNDTLAADEQGTWGPIVNVGSQGAAKAPTPTGLIDLRDTLSGLPADHSAFTAAQPKTLACELMAMAPAGAHGGGAGITYNGHAGLGANYHAVSKGSIVTNNNDPDTLGRCRLSGEGE